MFLLPIEHRSWVQEKGRDTDLYWGFFWAEVNYLLGPDFDRMTLAYAAYAELSAMERILNRALVQA